MFRLPFDALAREHKPLVGFSDITTLQMALWRESAAPSIHGALTGDDDDQRSDIAARSLRSALMENEPIVVASDPAIQSVALTTRGQARGRLIGGSLTMMATAAGWALPSLRGAVLLIESDGMAIGQFERDLTTLVRAGHLDGIEGVAIGHINGTPPNPLIWCNRIAPPIS